MFYPKWIYFKDGSSLVVKSKEEHDKYPLSKESPTEIEAEAKAEAEEKALEEMIAAEEKAKAEAAAAKPSEEHKAETYKEHMEQWEAKEESQASKKKKGKQ